MVYFVEKIIKIETALYCKSEKKSFNLSWDYVKHCFCSRLLNNTLTTML